MNLLPYFCTDEVLILPDHPSIASNTIKLVSPMQSANSITKLPVLFSLDELILYYWNELKCDKLPCII
jgi:hypothetical protein